MESLTSPLDQALATKSKVRVLRLLLSSAEWHSTRELASRTGMAKRTIDLALGELSALGLVLRPTSSTWTPYRMNDDNALVRHVLRPLFEAEGKYSSDLFETLRRIIDEAWRGQTRVLYWAGLYGSVARNEEEVASDLDLLLVIEESAHVAQVAERLTEGARSYEERFGRRLSPLVITRKQLMRLHSDKDHLALSVVRDGRRLAGTADLGRLADGKDRQHQED